VNSTGLW